MKKKKPVTKKKTLIKKKDVSNVPFWSSKSAVNSAYRKQERAAGRNPYKK